jgi:broad specificity phosphatase PhoE
VKRLLLARHALAGSNRDATASCSVPGEGLTPEGIEQAMQLGVALGHEEIDLGVATELRRTQETLELALDGRGVTLVEVSELNEIDFGSFAGGPLNTYRAWAAAEPPALAAPGGGESRAAAAARFAQGLRILLARREETILAIAHALVVRYVVDAAEGLVPLPLMEPVEHAVARVLSADEVAAAAVLLDGWSRAPRFRDLPVA